MGGMIFHQPRSVFASGETMAHVYHLVEKGYIIMEERQGVLYFKKIFLNLKKGLDLTRVCSTM